MLKKQKMKYNTFCKFLAPKFQVDGCTGNTFNDIGNKVEDLMKI